MDLKTLQANLSGKPNPGSKSLLAQMKGWKQQVHNILNVSYRGKTKSPKYDILSIVAYIKCSV